MDKFLNLIHKLRIVQDPLIKGDKDAEHAIDTLKESLNKTKQQGWLSMCLLSCIVTRSDKELFQDNALFWLKSTVRIVNTVPSENLLALCYETLLELLHRGSFIDKIARDISQAIETMLAVVLNHSLPVIPQSFSVISCCLKHYGGSCSKQRKKLESFILSGTASRNDDIVQNACSTFPLLVVCGPGGDFHSKHIEIWNSILAMILKTIHTNYGDLLNSNERSSSHCEGLIAFPDSEEKDGLSNDTLFLHIDRSLKLLSSFVSVPTSFQVQMPIPSCIALFTEISTLLSLDLKAHDFYCKTDVRVALINIVSSFLNCLIAFLKQFTTLFIPYSKVLSKIVFSSLSSPFVVDRTNSYRVFSSLLKNVHVTSLHCAEFEDILSVMLKDVSVSLQSRTVSSTTNSNNNNNNNNRSRKSKGKSKNRTRQEAAYSADIDEAREQLSVGQPVLNLSKRNTNSALLCMQDVIVYDGPLLSANMLLSISSHLFNIIKRIYGNDGVAVKSEDRYSLEARCLLFKVLGSLLHLHNGNIQVPKDVLVSFFRIGTTDPSEKVSTYCMESLYRFEQVLHCKSPEFRIEAKLLSLGSMDDSMEKPLRMLQIQGIEQSKNVAKNLPLLTTVHDVTQSTGHRSDSTADFNVLNEHEKSPFLLDTSSYCNAAEKNLPSIPTQLFANTSPLQLLSMTPFQPIHDVCLQSTYNDVTGAHKSKSADHIMNQVTTYHLSPRRSSDPGDLLATTLPARPISGNNHQVPTSPFNGTSGNNVDAQVIEDDVVVVNISDDDEADCADEVLGTSSKKRQLTESATADVDVDFARQQCGGASGNVPSKKICVDNEQRSPTNLLNEDAMDSEEQELQNILRTFNEVQAD